MNVIVIEPNNESNFNLLVELAKKLGSKVTTLEKKEAEDFALLSLMKKERTGENVSRSTIMNKLKNES